ncbi:putative holin-like toxin, partial [Phascolarctobacterium succinatutens]|uniref:putative holin-like toxin n=1 Tax=Phascolarctobacterium succinatutens TaxID=626940 RepID=UPI003AF1C58E
AGASKKQVRRTLLIGICAPCDSVPRGVADWIDTNHCRVALPKFFGMEVMSMVYFSFQDLMSFGIFIVALLTFIFQNRK